MNPQTPIIIQEGQGATRALVYLLHVGAGKPNATYPLGTFDAIREACGPEPMIIVRGDDGTTGQMPIADMLTLLAKRGVGVREVFRIVAGGWSAGVRGIRRFLVDARMRRTEIGHAGRAGDAVRLLAGIVAADGLHAPWSEPKTESARALGPSEVFREYVDRARRGEFACVLTHCMQDYMESPRAKPRYLSTGTVARELTGWPCVSQAHLGCDVVIQNEARLAVLSYGGPSVDYDGHIRQQREALPAGLAQMRSWGLFQP